MTLSTPVTRRCGGLLLAGALLLGQGACTPGGPESASDTDLTVTVQVPETNYTGLVRYTLDDTIYDMGPDATGGSTIDQAVQDRIIADLRAQMAAAGFEEVDETANPAPQLKLVVGAVVSEQWFYYYGWGGYYGWYYPPYATVGSFEVGSVVWTLVDLRDVPPGGEPDSSIWLAGLNGMLSGSSSSNLSRLDAGIQQAFQQSPYIQAGQAR